MAARAPQAPRRYAELPDIVDRRAQIDVESSPTNIRRFVAADRVRGPRHTRKTFGGIKLSRKPAKQRFRPIDSAPKCGARDHAHDQPRIT